MVSEEHKPQKGSRAKCRKVNKKVNVFSGFTNDEKKVAAPDLGWQENGARRHVVQFGFS